MRTNVSLTDTDFDVVLAALSALIVSYALTELELDAVIDLTERITDAFHNDPHGDTQ